MTRAAESCREITKIDLLFFHSLVFNEVVKMTRLIIKTIILEA